MREALECDFSGSPIPLVSRNFSCIGHNLGGDYQLVEPVVLNTGMGLPLGNDTHPFTGRLTGTGSNSLELHLGREDPGDLCIFGGLEQATVNLCVHDSDLDCAHGDVALFGGHTKDSDLHLRLHNDSLRACDGNVALCAGRMDNTTLDVQMDHCELTSEKGHYAALVEELGEHDHVHLSMNDSHFTMKDTRILPGDAQNCLVAGPVARTCGSDNEMDIEHVCHNLVEVVATAGGGSTESLTLASMGWGYMKASGTTAPLANNSLHQCDLNDNVVRTEVKGRAGSRERAHASLAGTCSTGGWHRLKQSTIADNRVEVDVSGAAAGVASLGLVHDAIGEAQFQMRQQQCQNNTVRVRAGSASQGMAAASLALASDDSGCGFRCVLRCTCPCLHARGHSCDIFMEDTARDADWCVFCARYNAPCIYSCRSSCPAVEAWIAQQAMTGNSLSQSGAIASVSSATLLGGGIRGDTNPATGGTCPAPQEVFLFSGGQTDWPLTVPVVNSSVTTLHNLGPGREQKCRLVYERGCIENSRPGEGLVDQAAYSFHCTEEDGNCPAGGLLFDSTVPDDWAQVNTAFCETVPQLFDDKVTRCNTTRVCHSPGEQIHALVPPGPEDERWLLVTRQTWPAGSPGNLSDIDLFRVLPFSSPLSPNSSPQLQNLPPGTGEGYQPAGRLYNGSRVVPEGEETVQAQAAVVSQGTLYLAYQTAAPKGGNDSRIHWATVPLEAAVNATEFRKGTAGTLPSGAQLMLLSEEDDGLNLWFRHEEGTVERRSLAAIRQQGQSATATATFVLASGTDTQPLALARQGDHLYSLHQESGRLKLQRAHVTTGEQDPDWEACLDNPLPAQPWQLQVHNATGRLLLAPQIDSRGCLAWSQHSDQAFEPCESCTTTLSSSVAVWPALAPTSAYGAGASDADARDTQTHFLPSTLSALTTAPTTVLPPVTTAVPEVPVAPDAPDAAAAASVLVLVPVVGAAVGTGLCVRKRCRKEKVEMMRPASWAAAGGELVLTDLDLAGSPVACQSPEHGGTDH